jgi:hypothetical protein
MKATLPLLLAVAGFASAALAADPAPTLGPALTAAGAKISPTYFSKNQVLQLKADAPLSEDVWKEIEALAPHEIGAGGKGFDDAAVARLAKLPVELLYLDGASLTDDGWVAFKQMTKLKKLSMGHNLTWKGTGAAALANHPSLTSLAIGGSSFGDPGVPAIATIKQLQSLSLFHMGVTDAGLTALANHPAIESLKLSPQGTPRITDECLKTVVTLKALKQLSISDTVLTYDGGLKLLKGLPALQTLTLENIGLSDADLAKLKADLPKVDVKFKPWTPELIAKWEAQREKMKAAKK